MKVDTPNIFTNTPISFWIASAVLFLLLLSHTWNGHWSGDIWEHAAVIRELIARPFNPQHPLLAMEGTHMLFSPYHLTIALFSKMTGIGLIGLLNFVGLCNLVLWILSLHYFVTTIFKKTRVSIYALILVLFAWLSPWSFSGFFNFNVLGYVMALPSTFVGAFTLFLSAWYYNHYQSIQWFQYIILIVLTTLLLLIHPFTTLVLMTSFLAVSFHYNQLQIKREQLMTLGLIFLPILGTMLWPYYSFLGLITSDTSDFIHASNGVMYDKPLIRIAPALLGLPIIFMRMKKKWNDWISWFFIGLVLLYIFGYISGKYSFGRLISYATLLLQVLLGGYIYELSQKEKPNWLYKGALLFMVLLIGRSAMGIKRALPNGLANNTADKYFLQKHLPADATFASDSRTSLETVVYSGQLIASAHPLPLISDHMERRENLKRLYDLNTPVAQKSHICAEYDANYFLLNEYRLLSSPPVYEGMLTKILRKLRGTEMDNSAQIAKETEQKKAVKAAMLQWLNQWGDPIYQEDPYHLFKKKNSP